MSYSFSKFVSYIAIILIACFSLFFNLGKYPLACWDESRQAVNALEMLDHHNPLVTTFEGRTDLWNTKPSLLVATQSLSFKLFGINEFALRLPTAFAALILCLLIFWFFDSQFKSLKGGAIAVFILLSLKGFNGYHGVRTGDFESFLGLFSSFYIIVFYLYTKTNESKYLMLFFLGIILTVFSKGIAGLMFLPAIVVYLVIERKFLQTLLSKTFLIYSLLTILIISSYYLYRDVQTPGYLAAVLENELGGRFGKVIEGHSGEWNYYIKGLLSERATVWSILLPIACCYWFVFLRSNKTFTKPILYFSLLIISWLVVISTAKTKIEWYDFPILPLISILLGLLFVGFNQYYTRRKFPYKNKYYFQIAFVIILILSGIKIVNVVQEPIPTCEYCTESNHFGALINEGLKQERNFDKYNWATVFSYNAIPYFYLEKLKREHNQIIKRKTPSEWKVGDKIFLLQPTLLDSVPNHLSASIVDERFGIIEVELHESND